MPFYPRTTLLHCIWAAENGNMSLPASFGISSLRTGTEPSEQSTAHVQPVLNFNSTNFQFRHCWSKHKRPSENERKDSVDSDKYSSVWSKQEEEANYGCEEAECRKCCMGAACSEPDTILCHPSVSTGIFYLLFWGKRQPLHRKQQPAAKGSREAETQFQIKRVRQPQGQLIHNTWSERKWRSRKHSNLSARGTPEEPYSLH